MRALALVSALAESYRYLLRTGSQRLVPLADELALLDQFLALVTIRYADGLRVNVHVDAQAVHRWQLPPVVLPELLENAVKHNEFSTDNPLQIEVRLEGDRVAREAASADRRVLNRGRSGESGTALQAHDRGRGPLGRLGRAFYRDPAATGRLGANIAEYELRDSMPRILSSLALTCVLLCPWTAAAQVPTPPSNCSVSSQNVWVRNQMNTFYYWNQFLPDVNPTSYASPEAYLEAVRYRPIDNYYSGITSAAANDSFYNDSQTIAFGFVNQPSTNDVVVLQVYPESPASEAGLERGDRITHVNGQSVVALVAAGSLNAAFGVSEVGVAAEITFTKPGGETKQARMVKRLITIPSVSLTRAVDVAGRRVGYLNFKAFVRPSEAALNEAFAALRTAGVNELVLDLRYNGGGLVNVASHLAGLIGGTRTSGQVLFTQSHNSRLAPTWNETTRFTNPDQALNLERLVVITTRASASASELVINSLRPYIPVVVVGDTTYGKPVGQYGLTFCNKVLYPVAFTLRNANDEGDYFDGIPATCAAADDASRPLGDVEEGSFAEALTYIRTGACSPRTETASRALRVTPDTRLSGWAALVFTW